MMREPLHIVVTGEVDSGKSTLIGRFLYDTGSVNQKPEDNFDFAYLLDSLKEERTGQLTIDMTQAFCKTKSGKELIFIDVPGHKELLKNMLCGSSCADMAILVVDIQKSVETQTKRHAFILDFLGIKEIIIVLNKVDLVGFDETIFKKVKAEINKSFNKLRLQPEHFIPVSAKQGENLLKASKKMPWYKGLALISRLNHSFNNVNKGAFRFTIQDIYNINKEKIAVGRILSGGIRRGEFVTVIPDSREGKIEKILDFKSHRLCACAPQSLGLKLADMDGLKRGQIICKAPLPEVSRNIASKILCLESINAKESLTFRSLNQESSAHIDKIKEVWDIFALEAKSKRSVKKNDFAEVIIETINPVVVEKYSGSNSLGRFVLERDLRICAIGLIS